MENSIFESKEQYLEMRKSFKKWYNTEDNRKSLFARDFALYAAIRGKDWKKCFAPNSKEETLEHAERYITKTKFQYLDLSFYNNTVTEEMINKMREVMLGN